MPFEAPTPYALMDKHLNSTPKPPTDYQPTLPNGINRVVEKALAKDPLQRYESAGVLADAFAAETRSSTQRAMPDMRTMVLEEVPTTQVEQERGSGQPTTVVNQQSTKPFYLRPIVAVPAVLIVLAMLAGGFIFFSNMNGDNEDTTDDSNAMVATDETGTDIPTVHTPTNTPSQTEAATATATDAGQTTSTGEAPTRAATQTSFSSTGVAADLSPTTPPATETPTTPAPTFTVAITDTDVPTRTNTPTNTLTHTPTPTNTDTPTSTPTFTPTLSPTFTPSLTFTAMPPTTAIGLPGGIPVTANDQWEPLERTINGVTMVLVPAGTYTMGATTVQHDAVRSLCPNTFGMNTCNNLIADEVQSTVITFSEPFWIDKTEVSNATYYGTGDQLPIVDVTWALGQQHCTARGGRLPTEAEWEYAARGPDSLYFPWGNTWDDVPRANICDVNCPNDRHNTPYDDGYAQVAPVGSFPDGASWVGALDMGGNVWEYTSTIYRNNPYNAADGREDLSNSTTARTLRGSSWNWIALETTTTSRATHIQNDPDTTYYGFRCARDYVDGDLSRFSN
jgi:formylglycine-generating enzyme required for sulfatase activity